MDLGHVHVVLVVTVSHPHGLMNCCTAISAAIVDLTCTHDLLFGMCMIQELICNRFAVVPK